MTQLPQAWFAGCRRMEIFDEGLDTAIPALILYPTREPERSESIGPFHFDVAMEAPVARTQGPLIVISHGTGGSPLNHRTLAVHLARNGCVVALPEHPRNNRNNNDLAGTAAILAHRPRQVGLVLDAIFGDSGLAPAVKGPVAAVIGHSLGGYTALAVGGGRPTAFPWETSTGASQPVEVKADPRVRALVLLAPAAAWFLSPGSLEDVRIPILMLTGEKDEICEVPGRKTLPNGRTIYMPEGHSAIVKRGLAAGARIEHEVIPNAGHFSFLSPFPPALTIPGFPPSQDPEGFDREGFQPALNTTVLGFLNRALPAGD